MNSGDAGRIPGNSGNTILIYPRQRHSFTYALASPGSTCAPSRLQHRQSIPAKTRGDRCASLLRYPPPLRCCRLPPAPRAAAPLKQIAAPPFAKIDAAAIAPVRFGQRCAKAVGAGRHWNQVDMVVHQPPREARRSVRSASFGDERQISLPVVVGKNTGRRRLPRCLTWCALSGIMTRAMKAQ